MLKWVVPHCRRAVGLDVSSAMLRKARRHLRGLPQVELKRLPKTLKFPFRGGSFDFIYFFHVVEHLEREDALTMLREIRRSKSRRMGEHHQPFCSTRTLRI